MSKRQRNHNSKPASLVDVIVTTAGRFDMLKVCLEKLKAEKEIPISVCVIDDASPAEERIQNAELFLSDGWKIPFHTKRLQQSVGFPMAANEGANQGHSPIILFLSDDVVIDPDTISQMVRTLDDPTVGVVGAKLIFPLTGNSPNRPAGKVQHIGLAVNIRGDVEHPLVGWSPENQRTCVTRDVFATTGGCFMIRRELFRRANGFDAVYGKGTYEDVDLCLKVRQMGARIVVNAKAIAHHYVGATVEKQGVGYPLRNNAMIFQTRWMPTGLVNWDLWTFL